MTLFKDHFYKMSNYIFGYHLNPTQISAYNYLAYRADQQGYSYPSVKSVAACCGCSENSARKALHELEQMRFIDIQPRCDDRHGIHRQTSNLYKLLPLPPLPDLKGTPPTVRDEQDPYEQRKDSDADLLPA